MKEPCQKTKMKWLMKLIHRLNKIQEFCSYPFFLLGMAKSMRIPGYEGGKTHLASEHSKTQLLPTLIISDMVLSMKPRCWVIRQKIIWSTLTMAYEKQKRKTGTFLVIKTLCFQYRFNPWLRNCDPTCCVVWAKKKKKGIKMKPPSKGCSFTYKVTREVPLHDENCNLLTKRSQQDHQSRGKGGITGDQQ